MPRKPRQPVCEICGAPASADRELLEIDGHLFCPECLKRQEEFVEQLLSHMDGQFEAGKAERKPAKDDGPRVVPSPRELKGFLDQYIVGQDEAKRVLAVAVHNHYKRIESRKTQKDDGEVELEKSNILLVGPTGSGKTLLARTLARVLNVPFAIADATTITEAGYVGEDVENILLNLIRAAEMDVSKAEKGIVFIDEIDKIARKTGNVSITRDVSGEGVQQALLKILEGTEAHVPPAGGRKHPEQTYINIQTKDILFICGGAFVGLDKILEKRSSKNTFGFTDDAGKTSADVAKTVRPEPEDFIEFGLIPEFIGRLPVVSTLQELSEDDLVHILTEPKNSLVKQYKKLFSFENIALEFEPGALRAIAHEAVVRKTGARGLRAILEDLMTDLMFDAAGSSDAPTPARKLTLTEALVTRVLRHEGGSLADALVPA